MKAPPAAWQSDVRYVFAQPPHDTVALFETSQATYLPMLTVRGKQVLSIKP
jgi:hypothetical protein